MSKVVVTDLEHIPEGPPRDLMMYLDDNGEVIQLLDGSIFGQSLYLIFARIMTPMPRDRYLKQ